MTARAWTTGETGHGHLATRKHIMTLYAGTTDPQSHRTRIVLYEKDVECQVIDVDIRKKPREIGRPQPVQQRADHDRPRSGAVRARTSSTSTSTSACRTRR
ncbi:MAG: hypothetical protein MZV65_29620 [Chromatiales bacterium]|nr:hypothetical protein [Chromatiales bacterium]